MVLYILTTVNVKKKENIEKESLSRLSRGKGRGTPWKWSQYNIGLCLISKIPNNTS